MKIASLRLFIDVMRAGGFAAAARQRDLDPSSVSRAIAGLEKNLGCVLFDRSTRRFQPTAAGLTYFEYVEPLLDEIALAGARARDINAELTGNLRVSASVAFGTEVLAPLVGRLRQRYPALSLEFLLNDGITDLVGEHIDLAIRLGPPPRGDLVRSRIMPTRHRVCVAPQWLSNNRPLSRPQELEQHACVRFPYAGFNNRWRFRNAAGTITDVRIGADAEGGVIISNALALKRCVLDGAGPGLLADWMIGDALAAGTLVDLLPAFDVTASSFDTAAWAIYPARAYVPLKVKLFIDFLRDALATAD